MSGVSAIYFYGTIPDVIADDAPCSVLMVRRNVPEHWSVTASEMLKGG